MNGIQLKEKTGRERAAARWDRGLGALRRLTATRAGQGALAALGWLGGAFLLAGLRLPGGAAPAAACLPLCVEDAAERERRADRPRCSPWLCVSAALVGACLGYCVIWGWEAAMEPVALSLSSFAGALIFRRTPISRSVLAVTLCLAVGGLFLLDTGFGFLPLLRLGLGTGLAALTPRALELRRRLPAEAPRQLAGAAQPIPAAKAVEKALLTMHGVLAREDPLVQPAQLAEVYDFAADRVCRCCVRHGLCWEQNAEDTYRDLCAAGEAILRRGAALREDLPERFTTRCCHTAGFVTAVNQALDEDLIRRREARRRVEGRRVAADQYLALQRLLAALARPKPGTAPCYAPELAVGSAGRAGSSVSGDRGALCTDRFGRFYVLLCDGMGTGAGARSESDRAARLLTAFLGAGLEADTALGLINDFYVLRRETAFSTLDLLQVDLCSGAGTLYKWGAAPSYLRRGGAVEKIGTATTPPGLEAAEGRVPGQYALSLGEGETLVMLSDGADGEETVRRLTDFDQGTVRDLASCLIAQGEAEAEDDRTAVVIRLREMEMNQEQ